MKAREIFNPKLAIGLIFAGIVAFVAFILLLAYGGGAGPRGEGSAAAPARSAVGYAGLVDLVGRFRPARIVGGGEGIESEDLLVVALTGAATPDAVQNLLRRRGGRATLLIMPKWITRPDPARRGWVRSIAPAAGSRAERLIGQNVQVRLLDGPPPASVRGDDFLGDLTLPVPRDAQVISGNELDPLFAVRGEQALVARIGEQPHFVLADPDLLNNHGLREPANARAALRLLDALSPTGAEGINFDLASDGRGGASQAPSMLRLAFEPPFLAMTLALFFAALAAGFYGAFRFGPVRHEERAIALGKAALVENSAGLIRLARREARLGSAYADVVRSEAARLASAPPWLSGEKLDAYLDRIGRPGAPPFTALADALTRAADRSGLIAAARALHLWKKDLVK